MPDAEIVSTLVRVMLSANARVQRTYHEMVVLGSEKLPERGAAIVVANHISPLDPLLIQALTTRHIRWMCAREYTQIPGTGWFWREAKVIPVGRDGRDAAATRAALRVLEEGHLLGVFPEGRIQPTRRLLPLQPGLALLASKSQAPLVPVWVDGIRRGQGMLRSLLWPQCAVLRIGEVWRPEVRGAGLMAEVAERLTQLSEDVVRSGWACGGC